MDQTPSGAFPLRWSGTVAALRHAGKLPIYSGGPVPEFHRLPYSPRLFRSEPSGHRTLFCFRRKINTGQTQRQGQRSLASVPFKSPFVLSPPKDQCLSSRWFDKPVLSLPKGSPRTAQRTAARTKWEAYRASFWPLGEESETAAADWVWAPRLPPVFGPQGRCGGRLPALYGCPGSFPGHRRPRPVS